MLPVFIYKGMQASNTAIKYFICKSALFAATLLFLIPGNSQEVIIAIKPEIIETSLYDFLPVY
jgi:hypothetical protein